MKTIIIPTFLIFMCSFLLMSNSMAQTILATPSETVFEDIKLTKSITIDDNKIITELKSVSYGVRKKKVFLLAVVKIYVAEFFAAEPTKLVKTDAGILNSLKSAGSVQLRFTASRDLTGSQISESFKEALKENGIDLEKSSSELTDVLAAIHSVQKIKNGEVFSLTSIWKNSTATLLIQKPDQTIQKISGPEKFAVDLFSIWFGKPADPKLEDLKKSLLK